ncbi:hypothetical protein JL721_11876 [Aureococcus anophagefferens]|nr:hypothetical protein JL721_11876 [Aureococcus anophagefferens]
MIVMRSVCRGARLRLALVLRGLRRPQMASRPWWAASRRTTTRTPGETITLKGKIAPEVSQAAFLVFCTFICFASLALVLQIQVPTVAGVDVGSYWFLTTLLSPYAGLYYWKSASDNEQREVKVKLSANDDESQTLMVVRGDKKDVQRMEEDMDLQQEGIIRVRGVFDYTQPPPRGRRSA